MAHLIVSVPESHVHAAGALFNHYLQQPTVVSGEGQYTYHVSGAPDSLETLADTAVRAMPTAAVSWEGPKGTVVTVERAWEIVNGAYAEFTDWLAERWNLKRGDLHALSIALSRRCASADADLDDMANDLGALWGEKVDA